MHNFGWGSRGSPSNVLVYATSNRRYLLLEYHSDNQGAWYVEGEIHYGEAVEEKFSLRALRALAIVLFVWQRALPYYYCRAS